MNANQLLQTLSSQNISLSVSGENLVYEAPGLVRQTLIQNIKDNKPQILEYLEAQVDPRPDLVEDSHLWVQVLGAAYKVGADKGKAQPLYGLLHGLRCGGAKLKRRSDNSWFIDYKSLLVENGGKDSRSELLKVWLIPAKAGIKAALAVLNDG